VSYLDAVAALNEARAYKRRTFELMQLHAGDTVLDVGCGAGDDLRGLAELVAPAGHVIGIDSSETMLAQANARTAGLPVECQIGDAQQLEFPSDMFAGVRADRVFQHLERPRQALVEMIRVTERGGHIVVAEPDWDSLLIDASDVEVTRRIRTNVCDRHRNGWMGRQLSGMFGQAGLLDVSVVPVTVVFTDLAQASALLIHGAAEGAVANGTITQAQASAWDSDLERRANEGRFFSAMTVFVVAGRKP
jgi:ubiquinone/menaquinone biosynthesis C-methylase UbiE